MSEFEEKDIVKIKGNHRLFRVVAVMPHVDHLFLSAQTGLGNINEECDFSAVVNHWKPTAIRN